MCRQVSLHGNLQRLTVLLAVLLWLPALGASWAPAQASGGHGTLYFSVIDVDLGDSLLLEFPDGKTMLIDAGKANAGQRVVDYLSSRGIHRIDYLVATHPHSDHVGGIPDILENFQVGEVWDTGVDDDGQVHEHFMSSLAAYGLVPRYVRSGYFMSADDVTISVLAPEIVQAPPGNRNENNFSIVLYVKYDEISFLLTGDMEAAERRQVSVWPDCTLLKAAHHGSRTGTDGAFVAEVKPEAAVISYAPSSNYGFPHREAIEALSGVELWTTEENGTVFFYTDGDELWVREPSGDRMVVE